MDEREWLANYGEAMRWAQKFEDALLGLLLTVRDYRYAKLAAADFVELLKDDFKSTAGKVLLKLFDDTGLMERVVRDTFGIGWPAEAIRKEFKAAVDTRNILAHYYFRTHHQFGAQTAEAFAMELDDLGFLLVVAMKTADSLRHPLSPTQTFRDNREIFRREIQTLLSKSDDLKSLARMGTDLRGILSKAAVS